ncbi:MAG TPA: cyclase family protein [Thermomicrobiales bacterium]|nr:cyclase family protein [Thermomicrobiales bacterium]
MTTAATDPMRELSRLFARTEVVDLSAVLEEGAPIWPTHPPLIIHRTVTHERHGYFTNSIFMPEHIGTHCDAPAHAVPELMDQTIDRYPIDQMIGPAAVIDVSDRNLQAGEMLTAADIRAWETEHSRIQPGEIVLINFGWLARHWRTDEQARYYVTNQPGLDESAVKLLYERGIKALGSDNTNVETPIRDGVMLNPGYAHKKYFLPNGVPLIESLANLDRLPPRCWFFALPLKIKGDSGSPIRPIALIPRVED